jgi:hypothetical protein
VEHRRLATWSVRSIGLSPALGRKMLQLGKLGLVGIVVRRGLPGQIEHVPDKHRAYGMNGVMPIKPFVHKPLCGAFTGISSPSAI